MAPAGVAAGVASAAAVGPPQGRSGLAVSGPAISLKPLPRSVLLWRARQRSRAFGVTVAAGRWVAGSLADGSVLKHTAETGGSCAIPIELETSAFGTRARAHLRTPWPLGTCAASAARVAPLVLAAALSLFGRRPDRATVPEAAVVYVILDV
jgi:hypothetical protein